MNSLKPLECGFGTATYCLLPGQEVLPGLHKGLSLGKPKSIRVDQGPEFVNKALDLWAYLHGVT